MNITHSQYEVMVSAYKKDFIPNKNEMNLLNSFMLCRWMSNDIHSVEFANFINNHTDIPINVQYWFARSIMNKVTYMGRPPKEDKLNEYEEAVSKYYNISFNVAKQYCSILPKEKQEEILNMFKGGRIK
ncbi:putative clamp loader subunit [Campylobacter phage F356]|uniref:Putative clamp loader subunit n=18 Tax=Fletchervirus TaxID=1636618 RepID=A0A7T3KF59_9CAUD|nr:clamp loader of DNA polymerase [Campylobacter phage CP30A]YP_009597277.1 clamp loader of DNA polymerase [Campylobacter phage vB_CjeM_Los1]QPX62931.1 putative clamp loader subunit [Campylobacter phage F207]QPX63104.1 putative clamp loader subunit [Campylobacter phage F336]QPX63278.1 putative clamp loader subunit [Campylobacter phage F348]QPX63443.1 putative clamp loader subunit [Campylobacter phage F352]QPX63611.1 putative clamp loader subunit [Campylobacter phage F355]QPX63695.1 putative 